MRFRFSHGDRPIDGYTVIRGVGIGGFGEVYYARSDGGKDVAIKVIRSDRYDVELRGVRQCLNLKHPNLIDIYDIRSNDDGDYFLIMEYISGKSLADVLEEHPDGLPLDEARHWFEGIASAVAYLHRHGIVHRDLKPQNIFQEEGVVKVGDYGLSKHITASQQSGHTTAIGTVHYMAPEVGSGHYGHSIDIFAVGIILYEMLTGKRPFDGESVGEVLMGIATKEPDYSRIPDQLVPVLQHALAKDPQQRYQSMDEFLDDFRAAIRGEAEPQEHRAPGRHQVARGIAHAKNALEKAFKHVPPPLGDKNNQRQPIEKIFIRAALTTLVIALLFPIAGSLMGTWMAFAVFMTLVGIYLANAGWGSGQQNQPDNRGHLLPPAARVAATPSTTAAESQRPSAAPVARPAVGSAPAQPPTPPPAAAPGQADYARPAQSGWRTRLFDIGFSLLTLPFLSLLAAVVLTLALYLRWTDAAVVTVWLAVTGAAVILLHHIVTLLRVDTIIARLLFATLGLGSGLLLYGIWPYNNPHPWAAHLPGIGLPVAIASSAVLALLPWNRLLPRFRTKRLRIFWIVAAFAIGCAATAASIDVVRAGLPGLNREETILFAGSLLAALATTVQLASPWTERARAVRPVP